ncbi:MAG: hypothetical protein U9Q82_12415 [Chloroflexota bacterium]|nr:hypothetical protein [Chloroflexota bacterium]
MTNANSTCLDNIKKTQTFLALSSFEGIVTLIILAAIPRELSAGHLFGYSLSRLAMMTGMFLISVVLFGILIWLRHRPDFGGKLVERLEQASNRVLWFFVVLLSLGFLIISFLLLQWLFIATDEYLRAYLQRLTPVLVYAELLCIQLLIFARGQLISQKTVWRFRVFVLGILTLLPWLLVLEYFVVDSAFPAYYVAERYLSEFRIVLPLALFVTALYAQILVFVLRQYLNIKVSLGWVAALLFIIVGYYYYNASMHHAEMVNDNPEHSDQSAYMEFARMAHETNFSYTGVRNQMPLYPYVQALFYRPELGDAAFFEQGKQTNIILSLVLLSGLFVVFRQYLSIHRATVLTLIIAVGLFIFKSAYFTSELLYYTLSFIGFLMMGLMLLTPSLLLGVATGVILALTYLTKASILPALAAFAFTFLVKEVVVFFRSKRVTVKQADVTVKQAEKKERIQRLASFSLVLIVFLIVLFPYLRESKQKYDHYFYNVNSTFYIWYDTWTEAVQDTAQYGYRQHWPNLPPEEIPSWRNYLRAHSFVEIKTRLLTGLEKQIIYLGKPYSAVNYILIYNLVMLLLVPWVGLKQLGEMIKRYFPLLLFFLLNFFGYLVLFAWYFPLAGGPRFIYGLFLPVAFFLFVVTDKLSKHIDSTKIKINENGHFYLLNLVDAVVFATLLIDFYYVITTKLPGGYFGS